MSQEEATPAPEPAAETATPTNTHQPTRTRAKKAAKPSKKKPAPKRRKPKLEVAPPAGKEVDPEFDGSRLRGAKESQVRLELTTRAFDLYALKKMNFSQIARELGLHRHTVKEYISEECERRRAETLSYREAMIERSLDSIDEIEVTYLERSRSPLAKGDEGRYVLEAIKVRNSLMGLDQGIKITHEGTATNPFAQITTAEQALEVLKALPGSGILSNRE